MVVDNGPIVNWVFYDNEYGKYSEFIDGAEQPLSVSDNPPAEAEDSPIQSGDQSEAANSHESGAAAQLGAPDTGEITGPLAQTAYWTPNGKSYHFSDSCPTLSRSKTIYSGTLQDALDKGKKDPCDKCANG